jgi:hypothetical protein
MTRIYFEEALYGGVCSRKEKKRKMKNYAGSENHSPHRLRKRSHFGTEENQWGSRGLQAWPETGS